MGCKAGLKIFVTFGGLGLSPYAPGTVASLGALIGVYILSFFSWSVFFGVSIIFCALSLWAVGAYLENLKVTTHPLDDLGRCRPHRFPPTDLSTSPVRSSSAPTISSKGMSSYHPPDKVHGDEQLHLKHTNAQEGPVGEVQNKKGKDPQEVVVDEVMGILISFFLVPLTPLNLCIGFVLFRVLDIFKPPPISFFDRKVPGAVGVMGDDMLAGAIVNMIFHGVWLPYFPHVSQSFW